MFAGISGAASPTPGFFLVYLPVCELQPLCVQLLGKWYIHRWAGTIPFHPEKRKQPLPPFFFVINGIGVLEFRMRIR